VIEIRVVGDDYGTVDGGKRGGQVRGEDHFVINTNGRDVGVAVGDHAAEALQQMNDIKGGGFTDIINVALVSHADHVDTGAIQSLVPGVQRVLDFFHYEVRHVAVDVAGKIDESGFDAGLTGFPGKIERIDGDAVATQSGARIKRHETEWLGGR